MTATQETMPETPTVQLDPVAMHFRGEMLRWRRIAEEREGENLQLALQLRNQAEATGRLVGQVNGLIGKARAKVAERTEEAPGKPRRQKKED